MRQKINIITLGVNDMEKTLKFYEEGLKWKRSDKSQGDIVFFDMGGIVLAFFPDKALAKDANTSNVRGPFSGVTIAYNAKSQEEVDEVLQEVEKLGAEIIKPAEKVFWGGYSGYFKDLDGHLFEVAHNPFVEFNEQDQLIM